MWVKLAVILVVLLQLAVSADDLASSTDTELDARLTGDWYSLLPKEVQAVRDQLIQELTPPAPSEQEKVVHEMVRRRRHLLAAPRSHF